MAEDVDVARAIITHLAARHPLHLPLDAASGSHRWFENNSGHTLMSTLVWIIIFTLTGGLLSVGAAGLFLLIPNRYHPRILPHGLSFAVGALLSVAFLDLLPDALHTAGEKHAQRLLATVLAGIIGFFLLEKLLLWRHCHTGNCVAHNRGGSHRSAGTLIILGDAIHNFVDGVLIAAAFLTDTHLGIITSIAVTAHEIPQEIGDFAILIESGYSSANALRYNLMSSLSTLVGGVLAYFSLANLHGMLPYILALAASSFLYVAIADLIPSLHQRSAITKQPAFQQIGLITFSIFLVYWIHGEAEAFHGYQRTIKTKTIRPPESGPVLNAKIVTASIPGNEKHQI
ncbi:ZIP family metal transporter [Methylomonas sp. MV1]|uniref:ZIP family metal transporter n=1 Tax=Methylomonas sp. MV1 TaxID=3073620 RepID=UPI0028A53728|nr:ZIP family metal transporter [Methylomonas sp. MV1]MDT4332977.1 ZIP family metal transporter [Methylomonas sp. MV1]